MMPLGRAACVLVTLFVATTHPLRADPAADLAQIKSGQTQTFDGTGHPRSHGLSLQLTYPKTWINEEGDQPLVLQRFASDRGAGLVSMIIGSNPLPPETANRSGTMLTPAETRTMIPQGSRSVRLSSATLNGLPASTVEYTMEETPKLLLQRGLIFYVLAKGQLIVIHGMAVKPADQSIKAFDADWEAAKTLFRAMGDSLKIGSEN